MNDSNLYEIPEDMGYARPLMLSGGVHILLAGFLWLGAGFHQAPKAGSTVVASPLPPKQPSAMSVGNGPPYTSPASTTAAPIQTNGSERQANAVKDGLEGTMRLSAASSKTPETASQARDTNRRSLRESGASAKPQQEKVSVVAAKKKEKPSVKEKSLAKAGKKADSASPKRIAKAEPTRSSKNAPVKRSEKKSDVAEMKKLESMREAELRRISGNVS